MTLPSSQEFKSTLQHALDAERASPSLASCDTQLLGRQQAILCRTREYDEECGNLFNELVFCRIEKIVKNADLYAEHKALAEKMCPEEQYLLEKFRRERKHFKDVNVLIQELRRLKTKYGPIPGDVDDYVPDENTELQLESAGREGENQ